MLPVPRIVAISEPFEDQRAATQQSRTLGIVVSNSTGMCGSRSSIGCNLLMEISAELVPGGRCP